MENVNRSFSCLVITAFIVFALDFLHQNELSCKERNKLNQKVSVGRFRTISVYLIVCQVRGEDQKAKTHLTKSSISKVCELCCQQMLSLILVKWLFKSRRRIFCCLEIGEIILHIFQTVIPFWDATSNQMLENKNIFYKTTLFSVIAGSITQPFSMGGVTISLWVVDSGETNHVCTSWIIEIICWSCILEPISYQLGSDLITIYTCMRLYNSSHDTFLMRLL